LERHDEMRLDDRTKRLLLAVIRQLLPAHDDAAEANPR
jgi:hypothetical protein